MSGSGSNSSYQFRTQEDVNKEQSILNRVEIKPFGNKVSDVRLESSQSYKERRKNKVTVASPSQSAVHFTKVPPRSSPRPFALIPPKGQAYTPFASPPSSLPEPVQRKPTQKVEDDLQMESLE